MKDMGEIVRGELAPPTRTGKKAVVAMSVEVLVEVQESDDWNDMVDQAKDQLNKRVVEGNGFYPVSARADRVHTATKVDDMKNRIFVHYRNVW